jgi:ribosome-associated translation inhibitor RaiA
MKTSFSFKNLSNFEKGFVQEYCLTKEKIGKLEGIVDRINPDETLEVRVEKFVKKSAYKVSLILQRPMNIFVSEDDHTLKEAIDLAKDKMVTRLRKIQSKRKY